MAHSTKLKLLSFGRCNKFAHIYTYARATDVRAEASEECEEHGHATDRISLKYGV